MPAHNQGSVCQMLTLTWILSKWSKDNRLVKCTNNSSMTTQRHDQILLFLDSLILVHFPNMISQPLLCPLFALESELFSVTCNPELHNWYTSLWDFHKRETEALNGEHPKGGKYICFPKTSLLFKVPILYLMSHISNTRKAYRKWILFLLYFHYCHCMCETFFFCYLFLWLGESPRVIREMEWLVTWQSSFNNPSSANEHKRYTLGLN